MIRRRATAALREALQLDPRLHLARIDLAEVLMETGQHEEASTQLDAVPDDPDWDARVAALEAGGQRSRAQAAARAICRRVAADPADLEARLALAGALAARKAWRDALEHLLEIVRRDKILARRRGAQADDRDLQPRRR